MMDRFDRTEQEPGETPEEIVTRAFSRCQNWPKERLGVLGLAQGLRRASDRFAIPMNDIVLRCAEASQYCPTDADLITVAREMRDTIRRGAESKVDVTAEWQRQYGQPQDFNWQQIDHAKVKRVKDRERELLAAIKAKYPQELSWAGMALAAAELGYYDYAEAWHRSQVGNKRITAEQWKQRMEKRA